VAGSARGFANETGRMKHRPNIGLACGRSRYETDKQKMRDGQENRDTANRARQHGHEL
jgi:hypothetical protein